MEWLEEYQEELDCGQSSPIGFSMMCENSSFINNVYFNHLTLFMAFFTNV